MEDDFIDVVSNITDNNLRLTPQHQQQHQQQQQQQQQRSLSLERLDAVAGIRDSAFQPVFPNRNVAARFEYFKCKWLNEMNGVIIPSKMKVTYCFSLTFKPVSLGR